MYVPNYVPEPLEVPGNVTLERYMVRVSFIRTVTANHLLSVLGIGGMSFLPIPILPAMWSLGGFVALLLILDLIRIRFRGLEQEANFSVWLLPFVMVAFVLAAKSLAAMGMPVWAMAVGPFAMGAYTLACGRDYSFVGGGVLAGIGALLIIAGLCLQLKLGTRAAFEAIVAGLVTHIYFVYDLASLMARRRKGEEWAAVVDLYRDVFNIFGFCVRCLHHWRKHRIFMS